MQDLRTAAPRADQPLRRREHVPRRGAGVRRDRGAPARPGDGRGGEDRARPDPQVLRAGPHGHRGAGAVRRRRRRHLHGGAGRRGAGPGGRRRPRSTWTCRTRWSTTRSSAGATTSRRRATSRGSRRDLVGAYRAVGAGLRLRRLRARDPRRAEAATAGSSPAARSGSPTAPRPACSSSSPTPIRPRATRASPAFIVERDFPGFSVGKKEDKLGIRASSTTELILEQCEVPEANVLGPVGQGYKIAIETLNEGRIGIGAQMIGVAQGALEAATAYVKERKQFGKAIAEFQGVQFQLAQVATELEAARLMVYNAARLKDAGQPFASRRAMAKLFASQVAERVDVASASSCSAATATPRSIRRRSSTATRRSGRSTRAPATCSCRRSPRPCSSSACARPGSAPRGPELGAGGSTRPPSDAARASPVDAAVAGHRRMSECIGPDMWSRWLAREPRPGLDLPVPGVVEGLRACSVQDPRP